MCVRVSMRDRETDRVCESVFASRDKRTRNVKLSFLFEIALKCSHKSNFRVYCMRLSVCVCVFLNKNVHSENRQSFDFHFTASD